MGVNSQLSPIRSDLSRIEGHSETNANKDKCRKCKYYNYKIKAQMCGLFHI